MSKCVRFFSALLGRWRDNAGNAGRERHHRRAVHNTLDSDTDILHLTRGIFRNIQGTANALDLFGAGSAGAETMRTDLFSGVVYVFRAKRAGRVKLIFWDGTGVVLVAKRLE